MPWSDGFTQFQPTDGGKASQAPAFKVLFDAENLYIAVRLFDTKYYDDRGASLARLFERSECIVANRGGNAPNAVDALLARPEVAPFAHRIHVVRLPKDLAAVSATEVRHRLSRGEPVAELVPSEILPSLSAWGQHLPRG